MTALVVQITGAMRTIAAKGLRPDATTFNAITGVALLVLAVVFIVEALRAGRRPASNEAGGSFADGRTLAEGGVET